MTSFFVFHTYGISFHTRCIPSSGREANDRGAEAVDDEYIPIDPRLQQELTGISGSRDGSNSCSRNGDFTESEPDKRDASALSAECEEQPMKLPLEGTTYSSFKEMRRELLAFAKSQGYGIRIARSMQKVSKVTGAPVARKRLVWQCNHVGRAGKIGCSFSFNAVEMKIGTDRWEIRYKENASQYVHNYRPSDGLVAHLKGGESIMQNENGSIM